MNICQHDWRLIEQYQSSRADADRRIIWGTVCKWYCTRCRVFETTTIDERPA